jgi:hypothetical protein
MTDHHDDFGHFDDHHDPLPFEDPLAGGPDVHDHDHGGYEDHELDDPGHDDAGHVETAAGHDEHHEPDSEPEADATPAETPTAVDHLDVFPPALDVGALPEPVDGFPWIDTGSLGVVDPAAPAAHTDPVAAEELAEYAGTDLPPGVDPWAALADSDDPATSALAKWWSQD